MVKLPRQQHLVDARIQGDLIARMALVSILTLVTCAAAYGVRNLLFPFGSGWTYHVGPLLAAFALVLPIVVYDAVRVTNRLIAPVIRLWHMIRLFAEDREQVKPIEFREGDPWAELAHDFNIMLASIQEELDRSDQLCRQAVSKSEETVA